MNVLEHEVEASSEDSLLGEVAREDIRLIEQIMRLRDVNRRHLDFDELEPYIGA